MAASWRTTPHSTILVLLESGYEQWLNALQSNLSLSLHPLTPWQLVYTVSVCGPDVRSLHLHWVSDAIAVNSQHHYFVKAAIFCFEEMLNKFETSQREIRFIHQRCVHGLYEHSDISSGSLDCESFISAQGRPWSANRLFVCTVLSVVYL